jgi:carboxynorspermidine decarboxylase
MKFLSKLQTIKTPAYVADIAKIRSNLEIASNIKLHTGCTMLLATKAFSMFAIFNEFNHILDGTTASGLYEAKLGYEHFGGEVHAYSPAFVQADIAELAPICQHISFNSVAQLQQYGTHFKVRGLRINPRFSLVKNNPIYDPSNPTSRFGITINQITPEVLGQINLLHVHNLCENMATDSVELLAHLTEIAPHILHHIDYLNIGGGHYFTHPNYDTDSLIAAINQLQHDFNVRIIMESGAAHVYDAGYLVASVVDVVNNGGENIAILDASATCHMPDVLEVPYRPNVIGDDATHPYEYILAGNTCLTGDIIGTYNFATPLKPHDKIIFTDMMQYSMVKNTTFNGVPLPDIAVLYPDGTSHVIKSFGYEDFKNRLS